MFTIESIKNPIWANAEHTLVECEVKFVEMDGFHPFGASVDGDNYAHTKEVFDRTTSGEFGIVAEFVPIPLSSPSLDQPAIDGAETL